MTVYNSLAPCPEKMWHIFISHIRAREGAPGVNTSSRRINVVKLCQTAMMHHESWSRTCNSKTNFKGAACERAARTPNRAIAASTCFGPMGRYMICKVEAQRIIICDQHSCCKWRMTKAARTWALLYQTPIRTARRGCYNIAVATSRGHPSRCIFRLVSLAQDCHEAEIESRAKKQTSDAIDETVFVPE
jgi:hypothetical protein